MSKWLVELNGDSKNIEFIAELLKESGVRIFNEKEVFYLESKDLEENKSFSEIKVIIDNLIDTLNGVAILYYPNFKRIAYQQILRVNTKGEVEIFMQLHAGRTDITFYSFNSQDATFTNWLKIAQKDDAVAQALTLYGALNHNWKNLFMVLDVIQEDIGGEENLEKQNWVEKDKLILFKRTANNYNILGKEARHAKKSWAPSPNPMNLYDAQALFNILLREWLKFKAKKYNL